LKDGAEELLQDLDRPAGPLRHLSTFTFQEETPKMPIDPSILARGLPVHFRNVGGTVVDTTGPTVRVRFPAYDPARAGERGPAYNEHVRTLRVDHPDLFVLGDPNDVEDRNPDPGDSSSWFLGLSRGDAECQLTQPPTVNERVEALARTLSSRIRQDCDGRKILEELTWALGQAPLDLRGALADVRSKFPCAVECGACLMGDALECAARRLRRRGQGTQEDTER
jgi:hypothetical protein